MPKRFKKALPVVKRINDLPDRRQRKFARRLAKPIFDKHKYWLNYTAGGSKERDPDWKIGPPPSFYSLSTKPQTDNGTDELGFLDTVDPAAYDSDNNGTDQTIGYGGPTSDIDPLVPPNLNNDDTGGQITYGNVGYNYGSYTYAANNNDYFTNSGQWDNDLFQSADTAEQGYFNAVGMGDYYRAQQASDLTDMQKLQQGSSAYLTQQQAIVTHQAQTMLYNALWNTSVYSDAPPTLRANLLALIAYQDDGNYAQTVYMNARWGGDPGAVGLAYAWGFNDPTYGATIAKSGKDTVDQYVGDIMSQIQQGPLGEVINGVYVSPDQQAAVEAAIQHQNDLNNFYTYNQYMDNYRNYGQNADPNDLVDAYKSIRTVSGAGDIANGLKNVLGSVAQDSGIDTSDDNSFFSGDGLDSAQRAALLLGQNSEDLRNSLNGAFNDDIQVANLKTELYRLSLNNNQQDPEKEAQSIVSDISDASSTYAQYRQMLGEVKAYLSSKTGTMAAIGDALPNLPLLSFDSNYNLNLDTGYTSMIQRKYNALQAELNNTWTDGASNERLWERTNALRETATQNFLASGATQGNPQLLHQAADTSALVKDGLTAQDTPAHARSFEYQERYANYTDAQLQAKIDKNNAILDQNAFVKKQAGYTDFADDALDWANTTDKAPLLPASVTAQTAVNGVNDLRAGTWGTQTGKPVLDTVADSLAAIGPKVQAALAAFNGSTVGTAIRNTLSSIQTGFEATGIPAADRAFSAALNAPIQAASQSAIDAIRGFSIAGDTARAAVDATLGVRAAAIATEAAVTAVKAATLFTEGLTATFTAFFGPVGLLVGVLVGLLAAVGESIARTAGYAIKDNFTGQWYHQGDNPNLTSDQNNWGYAGSSIINAINPLSIVPQLNVSQDSVAPG